MDRIDVREISTVISDSANISNTGKHWIGALSPAFPPTHHSPSHEGVASKVRIGSLSPAFPPVRGPAIASDTGKVRIGSLSPAFPPARPK